MCLAVDAEGERVPQIHAKVARIDTVSGCCTPALRSHCYQESNISYKISLLQETATAAVVGGSNASLQQQPLSATRIHSIRHFTHSALGIGFGSL
jgi:hypothetical protein